MEKIFINGSRRISRLNSDIKERLENVVHKGFIVLVGDANGVDKAVQTFLYEKGYRDVIVYHSGDSPRNNIGNWISKKIGQESMRKDFDFYAAKDLEMAKDATYGISIWDGRSKGTLTNIKNLLNIRKSVLLYLYPLKKFYPLKSAQNLLHLMNNAGVVTTVTAKRPVEKVYSRKAQVHQLALKDKMEIT